MRRIDAISQVAEEAVACDALLVCNIGYPSRELYSVCDRPANFYMLGSMGLASSIGLGLALAQPRRRVIVLDGDGSVLMNLGTLATVANYAPENYLLVILDNGSYGSTGNQPTPTSRNTDLAKMARGAGLADVHTTATLEGLRELVHRARSGVIIGKVEAGNADVPIIDLTPQQIIKRFKEQCAPPSH